MNPTLTGSLAVLIWGTGLTMVRLISEQFGLVRTMCGLFFIAGSLTLLFLTRKPGGLPKGEVFSSPYLYLRWAAFVTPEACIVTALTIVQRQHVPFIILLNYLWPTFIILCSIWFAGVRVTRWWALLFGTAIVVTSIGAEGLGPVEITRALFENPTDRLAYLLAFIGAMGWGSYSALSRRYGEVTGGSSMMPFFQLTLGLALPLSFLPAFALPTNPTSTGYALLFTYAFLKFVAYLCWDFGMRKGNVVMLSLFADFIPWLSLAFASLFLNVEITTLTIISVVTLVAGAIVTRYGTLR